MRSAITAVSASVARIFTSSPHDRVKSNEMTVPSRADRPHWPSGSVSDQSTPSSNQVYIRESSSLGLIVTLCADISPYKEMCEIEFDNHFMWCIYWKSK